MAERDFLFHRKLKVGCELCTFSCEGARDDHERLRDELWGKYFLKICVREPETRLVFSLQAISGYRMTR